MPRDLASEKETIDKMPPLSREPDNDAPPASMSFRDLMSGGLSEHSGYYFDEGRVDVEQSKRDEIHPYVQALNYHNVESCTALEQAAFPLQEAASREKILYRLTVCGELALGLFTSTDLPEADVNLKKEATEHMSSNTLIAHVIATKTTNNVINDEDMDFPENWQAERNSASPLGHQEEGRTIALHSLAVLPAHQKIGLGGTILKSYLQRMHQAEIADRVALLAHKELVPFYEANGFVNKGKSKSTYGGGNWIDMVYEFPSEDMGGEDDIE